MSDITITCYGPRGSLPTPSTRDFSTVEFGGNTSCYYLEAGPFRVILDAGSGIRNLGNDLMKAGEIGKHFIMCLSHYHWDHIQGLPFCVPMFIGSNTFHFHGFTPSGHELGPQPVVEQMLAHQQSNPHFPVAHGSMPSRKVYNDHPRQFSKTFWYTAQDGGYCRYETEKQATRYVLPGDADGESVLKVTTIPLNHPDGCLGYCFEYMGKKVVYATDNEPLRNTNHQLNTHAKGADWLLLDAQYTDKQLGGMVQTFGHGSAPACVAQAEDCEAKLLVLHHHDPASDDAFVQNMEMEAMRLVGMDLELELKVRAAKEGQVWEI